MQDPERIVALVGRPNVGKSRLFNRLAGRRMSIVHDQPGVTRDIVSAEVDGDYTLLDTGGLGLDPAKGQEGIASAVEEQVDFAIQAAKVVVLVVDGLDELTALDETIVESLRRRGRKIVLAVNKIDHPEAESAFSIGDISRLGLGDPLFVSAEHGRNVDALRARISVELGQPEQPGDGESEEADGRRVRVAIVGRPNVGKSSLTNALLQEKRLLVSAVPGTTRDAVEVDLEMPGKKGGTPRRFRLVDTAGLRTRRRADTSVEFFSGVRTQHAIEQSDVTVLILDARDGATRQDQRLAGEILQSGRSLILAVNKWDFALDTFKRDGLEGYRNEKEFQERYEVALRKELFFLPDSPICFVSAQDRFGLENLLEVAWKIDSILDQELPTGKLNRVLGEKMESRPPRMAGRRRFKVYYAVHVGRRPFRIRLFCNQALRLDDTYRRYLEKGVMSAFGLEGCPIVFELVGKPVQEKDGAARPGRPRVPTKKSRKKKPSS